MKCSLQHYLILLCNPPPFIAEWSTRIHHPPPSLRAVQSKYKHFLLCICLRISGHIPCFPPTPYPSGMSCAPIYYSSESTWSYCQKRMQMSATLLIRAPSWRWAGVSLNSFQRIQREENKKENFHFLDVFLKEKLRQKYHHLPKKLSERKNWPPFSLGSTDSSTPRSRKSFRNVNPACTEAHLYSHTEEGFNFLESDRI